MATIQDQLRDGIPQGETELTWNELIKAEAADVIDDLVAAQTEVMSWIRNWSPEFEYDGEWPATEAKVSAAIARTQRGD